MQENNQSAETQNTYWEPFLSQFIDHLKYEKHYSAYTSRNYKQAITDFFKKNPSTNHINEITLQDVREYLIEGQRTHSRTTIRNHIAGINAFFKYILKHKIIDKNPVDGIRLPKLERKLPKFLTEKQITLLLNAPIDAIKHNEIELYDGMLDRLTLELIYGGGLRISEVVNLRYEAIDYEKGYAHILGKGNKERICPLGSIAIQCLIQFKELQVKPIKSTDFILRDSKGNHRTPQNIQKMLKKYLAATGLPLDITPHKLRHSYATHLLNNGADLRALQELLGHKSLSATQVYTHIDNHRLKHIHKEAHPRG